MKQTILSIETSCDETAAAVYSKDTGIRSNEVFSQIELHKKFGGVVPELASRSHIEKISAIVENALHKADESLNNINVIAVTNKPGLPGSLLAGVCFAKGLAWAKNIKIIGVDHIEGHTFSPFLEHNIPFPHLSLVASGGHTNISIVKDFGDYKTIGRTVDDAAGEAFDKVSKLINLPYPGGPEIEKLAREANFQDYFSYPRGTRKTTNFSFSGLKTAVLYDLVKREAYDMQTKTFLKPNDVELQKKVASSMLVCVADIFCKKIKLALKEYPEIKAITFAGGVACNKYIRQRIETLSNKYSIPFFAPSPKYCGDNAAMIAFVGNYMAEKKQYSGLDLDILR